jgi:PHD/YefM family antitoxin component YafN of YafNO toxin-antitoxin module
MITEILEMKLSESIKPISYFKAHSSEIINDLTSNHKTMVITQNGEARAVIQDVRVFEQTPESLALLKILSMSRENMEKGNVRPIDKSFDAIRRRIQERKTG